MKFTRGNLPVFFLFLKFTCIFSFFVQQQGVRKAKRRPLLKKKHIKARIELAKRHLRNPKRSEMMVFSDEKRFCCDSDSKTEFVSIQKGENPYEERLMQYEKPKKPSADVNVWLSIGPYGKGDLHLAENVKLWRFDGVPKSDITKEDKKKYKWFDGNSYLNLIENYALPEIKSKMNNQPFIFMQDGASIHTKTKDMDYTIFDLMKSEGIEIEDWSAKSCDLNPVENCWSIIDRDKNEELDRRDEEKLPKPKNKFEMLIMLKELWSKVDNEVVKRIYYSFARRMKLVLLNKGKNNFSYLTKTNLLLK